MAAALVLSAPGPAVTQALAARVVIPSAAKTGSQVKVGPIGSIGNFSTPLNGIKPSLAPSLSVGLPTIQSVGLNSLRTPQAVPAALDAGIVPGSSEVRSAILKRAQDSDSAPQGLYNIFLHRIGGGAKDSSPAESPYLAPPAAALGSSAGAKSWARRSFDVMLGAARQRNSSGRGVVPRALGGRRAVSGLKSAKTPRLLDFARVRGSADPIRSIGTGTLRSEEAVGDLPAPVTGSSAKPRSRGISRKLTIAATAAVVFGLATPAFAGEGGALLSGLSWESITGFFSGFSFSNMWNPTFMAISLGLGVAFHLGKYLLKRYRKKKAEKQEIADAKATTYPEALEKGEAAEALNAEAGKGEKVEIFDFEANGFQLVELDEALIAQVQAGAFYVTTDNTGKRRLVPKVADYKIAAAVEPSEERAVEGEEIAARSEQPDNDSNKNGGAASRLAPEREQTPREEETSQGKTSENADAADTASGLAPERETMVLELENLAAANENPLVGVFDFAANQFSLVPLSEALIEHVRQGNLNLRLAPEAEGAKHLLEPNINWPAPQDSSEASKKSAELRATMVQALVSAKRQENASVAVFDFINSGWKLAPLSDELIKYVMDGALNAMTDDSKTAIYLDVNIIPEAAQAEFRAFRASQPAAEEAVGTKEAVFNVVPRPQKASGVYGAAVGGLLGFALAAAPIAALSASPLMVLAVPLFGWALLETIIRDSSVLPGQEQRYQTFAGVALGTMAGAAALSFFGVPLAAALTLPALGAAVHYGINRWREPKTEKITIPDRAEQADQAEQVDSSAVQVEENIPEDRGAAEEETAFTPPADYVDEARKPVDEEAIRKLNEERAAAGNAVEDDVEVVETPLPGPEEGGGVESENADEAVETDAGASPVEVKTVRRKKAEKKRKASSRKNINGNKNRAARRSGKKKGSRRAEPVKVPRSFKKFSFDAQTLTAESMLAMRGSATRRARRIAKDARLVRVAVNLQPTARVIYIFHSRRSGQVITVYRKNVSVRRDDLGPRFPVEYAGTTPARTAATLTGPKIERSRSLRRAYAALKAEKSWFSPIRVELVSRHHKDPLWVFVDTKGRRHAVPATGRLKQPQQGKKKRRKRPGEQTRPPVGEDEKPPPKEEQPPKDEEETPPVKQEPPREERPPPEEEQPPPEEVGQPPPEEGTGGQASLPPTNGPHIHEGLFGFRRVVGLKHDNAIKRLANSAASSEIVDQIALQFHIARARVLAIGAEAGLTEASDRKLWLAIYDELQRLNSGEFQHLDHKKYQGGLFKEIFGKKAGFRNLANRSYPEGWKGALMRALEIHKHLVGLLFRLPYHLFDSFIFGYFRRAISFEFFHSTEDFLTLREQLARAEALKKGELSEEEAAAPVSAEKWLKIALAKTAKRGIGWKGRLLAVPGLRGLDRWLMTPLLVPLRKFIFRRATLAVFSAVAMGLVAGVVPLPLLSFHLSAIPILGPALVGIGHGLPMGLMEIPFIGEALGNITGNAMNALISDLSVGAILQTMILATMLTLPASVKARLMEARGMDPRAPPLFSRQGLWVAAKTPFSWTFWSRNLKSMFGLMLVGAEIEGIMTYAGEIDGFVNQAYEPLTGHEFQLFHTVAAAVERPEGQSPIPFGGAITWGNVLLYKLQDALGFNLTDKTYELVTGTKVDRAEPFSDVVGESLRRAYQERLKDAANSAGGASVVATVMGMARSNANPDLLFKAGTPEEMAVRREKALGSIGDIEREIARVAERIDVLESQLGMKEAELKALEKQSKPLTPEELAEYEAVLKALKEKRDEAYVQLKLAEIYDIENPGGDAARLKALQQLEAYFKGVLPPPNGNPGFTESIGGRLAVLKALQDAVLRYETGTGDERPDFGPAALRMDDATEVRIDAIVSRIEELRLQAKGELTNRDSLEKLLQVIERTRNMALRDRRDGSEMLEFHKNLAKLATVLDLAFSLNVIESAQREILRAQGLVQDKIDKVHDAEEQAREDVEETEENLADYERWLAEQNEKIKSDEAKIADMQELVDQTGKAVENIGALGVDLTALIARLDAEDSGQSAGALAEYQRRLALLPQLVEWYTNGKPSDPDFRNRKYYQDILSDLDDFVESVQEGLDKINTTPLEFAGVLVIAVPGVPEVTVTNPSAAQIRQLLQDRKAHWQAELADYQETLTEQKNRMDPNFTGTEEDDFGDVQPVSLPKRRDAAQSELTRYQAESNSWVDDMDAQAALVNAVAPGANLPTLKGLDLDGLQDAITEYKDKLTGVRIPSEDTPENFDAKMAKLDLARMLPQLGRAVIEWSLADATITAVDEALQDPLPQVVALLENVVAVVNQVIADVDQDVAYVNAGFPGTQNQALIDRKHALLNDIMPVLTEGKTTLSSNILPFMRDTIDNNDPEGDVFAKLFDNQITLYEGTQEALETSVPWALASQGALEGDTAGAHENIDTFRQKFLDLLEGYDDAEGHHEGINENLSDIARREDPNNNDTEDTYGEIMPYSLPKLIDQYGAENVQRAGQINDRHAEINDILDRIDALSGGQYNLAGRHLPTGIQPKSQASEDVLQRLVDDEAYITLGDLLTEIGNKHKDLAGDTDLGTGGDHGVPTGRQPPMSVDDNTMIALLALEAAKRMVPSTNQSTPDESSASFAVARYLFSNAAVEAAEENLYERIPIAKVFLNQAKDGINATLADIEIDVVYVDSNQTSETGRQVMDRKIAIFNLLKTVTEAGVIFYTTKAGWSREGLGTVDQARTYYDALRKIHEKSLTASDSELGALETIFEQLQDTFKGLEDQRRKLTTWMDQLNRPEESALRRIAEDLRKVQEKTRAVLEQNINYHDLKTRYDRSNETVDWTLKRIAEAQVDLNREMRALADPGGLSSALAHRIQELRIHGGSWMMSGGEGDATAALVVSKRDFGTFVETIFGAFLQRNSSAQSLAGLKSQVLDNPAGLSSILPDTQVLDFGDADGFYLVYRTQFAVPNGLESSSWVTLGNIAKLWGNNISVTGYQFASPPNDQNAPWGDKGVSVQVESIQGKNWVNYLNIDFHRFIQDIPPDTQMISSARQSRLLIFEDFAMMLFGDKLYVGLTGFADVSITDPGDKTQFYGMSAKTELKLTPVMSLTAEQQRVFAKDPRYFLQNMNLDFTGLDPDLDQDFVISAEGESKTYTRTQLGPKFDIAKLLESKDTFTVDLFWARTEGTDDYDQNSIGVNVLKGFTIRDDSGKPWMVISNKAGYERGSEFNTLSDRVSVTLPNWGIVVSAEGRLIGDAKTYFLEIAKQTGSGNISAGYGSKYVGQEPRLYISINDSFTLGELWRAVASETGDALRGADALRTYNKELGDFFRDEAENSPQVAELRAVFLRDVGVKLAQQDIGILAKRIAEFRKAGAFLDNTRIRGSVGYVTNPVGEDISDRAVGGGFVAGTYTTMTLDKTQKEQIERDIGELYEAGLKLQGRMLDLTREWQEVVVEIAQVQWELKMAHFMARSAPTETLRLEGKVKEGRAEMRLRQAVIRYNGLTGRSAGQAPPFEDLSANELEAVLKEVRAVVTAPDRMVQILHRLDPAEIRAAMGDNPFNIMDWIPWVDRLTVSFGAQFTDYLANQVIGVGITLRLPIYDPGSDEKDGSFLLEKEAAVENIYQAWEQYRLRAEKERAAARLRSSEADAIRSEVGPSADRLWDAIRAYRNGLIGDQRMREAFAQWHWYTANIFASEAGAALAEGWSKVDGSFSEPNPDPTWESRSSPRTGDPAGAGHVIIDSFQTAFDEAAKNSRSLAEIGFREQAASAMTEANAHRIKRFTIDLSIGTNLTADGVGWLPSIGVTGISFTPILTFELKPEELMELQIRQGEAQTEYYRQFKTKVEADLAVEIYRQAVTWENSHYAGRVIETQLIPQLQAELAAARSGAGDGDPGGGVSAAKHALDMATRRLYESQRTAAQSRATLNYLMGRPPGAAVSLAINSSDMLVQLKSILAEKNPVAADKAILESRVRIAQAVETMVDKNLKLEELRLEPVSLVVRSLGRLASALSDENLGNPDLVAAARVQTLEAERVRDAYERDSAVRRARAEVQLRITRDRLERIQDGIGSDPEKLLEAIQLNNQMRILEASLARLGSELGHPSAEPMPKTFAELTERVLGAEQELAYAGREPEVQIFDPERLTHNSLLGLRYFHARTSLGGDPIGKDFIESWVEVRLKDQSTPPEVLLALAKLRMAKADRIHANDMEASRSQGRILLSQFETNVRLLRWAEAASDDPKVQAFSDNLDSYRGEIRERLQGQADRIKVLLRLPDSAGLGDLIKLVPHDPQGVSGNLAQIADRFVDQVESLGIEQLRRTLFEDGIPASLGNEDSLIEQLKADVIAERMSYRGFTPVGAWGIFRGNPVGGFFLEAPDPASIQRGLENVLGDSIRRELQSQGRMQTLSLQLHLLMSGVADKAKLVESHQALIKSAALDYSTLMEGQRRGQVAGDELASAQDALVKSWLQFSDNIAGLKNDFIRLVTELEAIGYPAKELIVPPVRLAAFDAAVPGEAPRQRLLEYASRRTLDGNFSTDLMAELRRLGVPTEIVSAIEERAEVYRLMKKDAEAVAHHTAFDTAEKLELLTKADVEGRRELIEEMLSKVLAVLENDAGKKKAFLAFIQEDIRFVSGAVGKLRVRERETLLAVRETYADALDLPFALQGAVERLEKLHREHFEARQALLEDYMLDLRGPTQFIMRDRALDRYLKTRTAYDAEILKTFQMAEVKYDEGAAGDLYGLYDIKGAIDRQQALVRSGRGMLAIDALIMLEEGRLDGLRWERASTEKIREVLAALSRLREIRRAWMERRPDGLDPLYVVTEVAAGRRLWSVEGWFTQADVGRMVSGGQVRRDEDGRLWLTSKDGRKLEIVPGVDVASAERTEAREARDANAGRLEIYQIFEKHDFAVVSLDGREAEGMDYDEALAIGGDGRMFHFSKETDGAGLRPAKHPLMALWTDPADTLTILYLGDEEYSRDRFPTLEALTDHIARLRAAGENDEADLFVRLEAGPKGVEIMIEAAREHHVRSERRGWIGVKLQSYGFAVAGDDDPDALYLVKEDFDEALDSLRRSAAILSETKSVLGEFRAKADAAELKAQEQKVVLDGESLRFQAVEKEVRARITEDVKAKFPQEGDESDAAYAARVKGKVDLLTVKDDDFKDAQERHADALKEYRELNGDFRDLDRKADFALDDLKQAGTLVARAGLWGVQGEGYLSALRQAGMSEERVRREAAELSAVKQWRLYVSKDAALHIDGENRLVGFSAQPVFGAGTLNLTFGQAAGEVRRVRGELFGAILDRDQTLVKLYYDPDLLDDAAKKWDLETVGGVRFDNGGKEIDPNARLRYYVDPDSELPVMLNRRYLISRLVGSGKELVNREEWAIGPWNWGNIIIEIPRGVLQTPIELLTGRDPNQHNWLGRVHMQKVEGGATNHRGFFRRAVGFLDILDLLPDPVDWYFDPSQFPARVELESALKPGQIIEQKDARAGGKDIHFGREHLERKVVYTAEDLLNARKRVISYFEGGLRSTWLETRRGRAGQYETSRVTETYGRDALEDALLDPQIGNHPNSDGRGPVRLSGRPGHIAVDKVERLVRIRPGADQYEAIYKQLALMPGILQGDRAEVEGAREALETELRGYESALGDRLAERESVRGQERELWDKVHQMSWRIGAQRALERRMAELTDEITGIRAEIDRLKRYRERLREELRRRRGEEDDPGNPDNPDDDNPTNPDQPNRWWQWFAFMAFFASAISALIEWLRRRRERDLG